MMDQATELRKLVLRSMRERSAVSGPPPHLMLLGGGKGGVGVTTLAVNLSVGLAEQGARVVIVDADLYRSDVAALCGIAEREAAADLLVTRRDIHEVLQRGPAGIQVVPGLWPPGQQAECSAMAQERLLRQFRALGPHADLVVLDVGSGSSACARRLCSAADDLLLVTTPDSLSVMDTYARIKASVAGAGKTALRLVVNQCCDPAQAADVHRRIDQSCHRFLGIRVLLLGQVPEDPQVRGAASRAVPFVLAAPESPAARGVQRMAAQLWGGLQESLSKTA